MSKLSPYPKLQFFDDNGDPLAGGLVYSYTAGSTPAEANEIATYKDSVGTPNTNPIVLDSAGRADIWLGDNIYKLVLAYAGDTPVPQNPIWTVDNIQQSTDYSSVLSTANLRALAAGQSSIVYLRGNVTNGDGGQGWFYWDSTNSSDDDNGITIQPATNPAQGRWVRFLDGYIDPKWYGATGDGSTDDKNAFVAARVAATALTFPVRCTAGTYYWATDPAMANVPVMLMPNAVLKWTGYRPQLAIQIASDDFTGHFSTTIPYNYAPILSKSAYGVITEVRPEWFGALPDASTNNYLAIYKAMQSLNADGGTVRFSSGTYNYGTTITLLDNIHLVGNGSLFGSGYATGPTILNYTGTGNGIDITYPGCCDASISEINLSRSQDVTGFAIYCEDATENCEFKNISTYAYWDGIALIDAENVIIENVVFNGVGPSTAAAGTALLLGYDEVVGYTSAVNISIRNVKINQFAYGVINERSEGVNCQAVEFFGFQYGIISKSNISITGMKMTLNGGSVATVEACHTDNSTVPTRVGKILLIDPYFCDDNDDEYFTYHVILTGEADSITVIKSDEVSTWPIATGDSGLMTRVDGDISGSKRVTLGAPGSGGGVKRNLIISDAVSTFTYDFPTPTWVKMDNLTYADFNVADDVAVAAIFTLPAKCIIHEIFVRHTTAFAGAGVTAPVILKIVPGTSEDKVSLLQSPLGTIPDSEVAHWKSGNLVVSNAPANNYTGFNLTRLAMRKHYSKTIESEGASYFPYGGSAYANDSTGAAADADYVGAGLFDLSNSTVISAALLSTSGNLSLLTAGVLETSFLISKLP